MRGKVLLSGLLGTAVAAIAQTPAAMPGWMSGCWIEEKAPDRWVEECWTSAKGGTMLGSGRTGRGDRVTSWEAMQIIGDTDGLSFFGAPRGVGRTRFRMKADGGPGISFYNSTHDYPQRVRYWREGDALLAETALADGTKARRWRYRRM
jgi:hypothetical protein